MVYGFIVEKYTCWKENDLTKIPITCNEASIAAELYAEEESLDESLPGDSIVVIVRSDDGQIRKYNVFCESDNNFISKEIK